MVASLVSLLASGVLETTKTVYHVNPLHEGVLPIDMDTADVFGDAFFDLRSKVLPIECAGNSSQPDPVRLTARQYGKRAYS